MEQFFSEIENLNNDQISEKIAKLNKYMAIARRSGNPSVISQIEMFLESCRYELKKRHDDEIQSDDSLKDSIIID
jgi:hypothetical protein